MQRDFYQVLGVARTATTAEIRAAFTRLARRHHPDAAGGAGELPWRVQELREAYRCLADGEARLHHDWLLDTAERRHVARQRRVRRRLAQHDRRRPPPRPGRRIGWRSLLTVTACVAIVAHWSLGLLG